MRRAWIRTAAILAAAALGPVVPAAELVVIESSAHEYEAGTLVDAKTPVRLAEGEAVTFLAEDGKIHKWTGPYNGPATGKKGRKAKKEGKGGLLDAVSKLVGARTSDSSDVGAVRGGTASPPNAGKMVSSAPVWALLAHEQGPQCVVRGRPARFWRADAGSETQLVLKDEAADRTSEIVWAAGETEVAWPASMPRDDGSTFVVRLGDSLRTNEIVLREIPEALAGQSGAVAWMHAKGCRRQAKALLARLEEASHY
jgi:hypothetical protein